MPKVFNMLSYLEDVEKSSTNSYRYYTFNPDELPAYCRLDGIVMKAKTPHGSLVMFDRYCQQNKILLPLGRSKTGDFLLMFTDYSNLEDEPDKESIDEAVDDFIDNFFVTFNRINIIEGNTN